MNRNRSNKSNRARRKSPLSAFLIGLVPLVLIAGLATLLLSYNKESGLSGNQSPGDSDLEQLRQEVAQWEDDFSAERLADQVDMDDLEELEGVIETQRTVIRRRSGNIAPAQDVDKLEELLDLYDMEMGKFLFAQSSRLEAEAKELFAGNEQEEALISLQRAHDLQEQINDQYPRSLDRDPARLHRLSNEITLRQTEPMAIEADRLMAQAEALREDRKYQLARDKMTLAMEKQERLSREYRTSPYASLSRLKNFRQAVEAIDSAEDLDRMEDLLAQAQAKLGSRSFKEALGILEEAESIGSDLSKLYPGISPILSNLNQQIVSLRDTASSVEAFQTVNELAESCKIRIRLKDLDSIDIDLSAWLRAAEAFHRNFPESQYRTELDLKEIHYLHQKREDLPSVIDTVYQNLLPLNPAQSLYMYRTEVPQYLYNEVTGDNPSQNRSPLLPVDSVTWEEAQTFTQLLGWLLARPARLPTDEECKMALGPGDPISRETRLWDSEESGRKTQEVRTSSMNEAGFYDLLGNVSEWLDESSSNSATASLFGGSARDSLEALQSIPVSQARKSERNRFSGFRFIIEVSDE